VIPLKDDIPTRRFPILTVAIILINIGMFFFFQGAYVEDEQHFNERVVEYGAIPYEITHPGDQCTEAANAETLVCEGQPGVAGEAPDLAPTWLTLLTSMFMHGGLLHLGGNMLFLWIFGNNVEDSMGPVKFIAFYLLGGLAATALQVVIDPGATVPTVGASGAIAGVLGGYLILFPRARVVTLIFIVFFVTLVELPAVLILGFWFVQQVLFGWLDLNTAGEGGGVAYFAHIGGFVFGLVAIKLFADDRKRRRQTAVT
jgi:membrane associated rhomboid family serine protease